ncbi:MULTISPECIES: winged helix-turn-helix domain-containing protein [unclassified Mesorhizobium]|uniref:winged helix-turn-helix domain-containing protein n=1 Tax=unclassified Mesorhizobium TaxID=325217 RepID=UPI001CCE6E15|nr:MULTISPECIES: winged helix-turn-helix domain-containing protein [unclassified Mesorhizobium]MBZ9731940.1 winged helix-turn-helix domain-containing protein [Mesorhizobium sp. CA9]MBZ9768580.1 winged helix-turn-helix domain-containing protein [Mesorhizobium sp. CA6]MBZ9826253.1 winged helix-turn-helix domain-containing protein [Mesorhizobium sp. CA18]MBZ9829817.1 winged helix-turn-helix domain-containing protein [Mesorhizobium sp. CA2]MBZ9837668.1 winged helix-turn-helix domain-containing pro
MGIYCFGDFELNEESRALRLAGSEIEVQPLVFDFFAVLLRHKERALSKDELLERLWPDVTVTEASLQRVASLARGILRQGGMETALRNLPRFGYRICLDQPAALQTRPAPADGGGRPSIPGLPILSARAAVAARKWHDAAASFTQADAADELLTADLEEWALALECMGRPAEAIPLLARAVTAYGVAGERLRAASPAITLARIHLERGELAVAKGWHKRAAQLIDTASDSREHGLWCWMGARIMGAEAEPEQALALAEQAFAVGRHLDDPVVESLGLIYRGFFKLCLGETKAGQEDQDLAAALGLSSDVDPIVGGILYCNILWACRNFGDWSRANQWTLGYEDWCRGHGLEDLSGSCRLHRAEVLGVHGTLKEAEALVRAALDQLALDAPWATGDALRVLGDIHLAAGEFTEAETAYRASHAAGWDPQPGLALLQLEQGQAEAAFSALERSLVGNGWPTLQRRGMVLATLAKVAARTNRRERAKEVIAELETQPQRWPMASIQALTAEAKAELFMQEERPAEAARELQIACSHWNEIGSPINVADARLSLAALLIRMGDRSGAELELGTALAIAKKVDSSRLMRRCDELKGLIAGAQAVAAGSV